MTPTVPVLARCSGIDENTLAQFWETLSSQDRQAFEALFDFGKEAGVVVSISEQPMPVALFLITVLVEQQKTLQFLIDRLNYYDQKLYLRCVKNVRSEVEALS